MGVEGRIIWIGGTQKEAEQGRTLFGIDTKMNVYQQDPQEQTGRLPRRMEVIDKATITLTYRDAEGRVVVDTLRGDEITSAGLTYDAVPGNAKFIGKVHYVDERA